MDETSIAMRRRIRQQVEALGPRGVTSRVPEAIRTAVVDYAQQRQAMGADGPSIAREVGFSASAIRHWTRAGTTRRPLPLPLQPVAVHPAVVALPTAGLAIVLPSGVRIEGLAVADVGALLAQLA